jgi:hypothetical protein
MLTPPLPNEKQRYLHAYFDTCGIITVIQKSAVGGLTLASHL